MGADVGNIGGRGGVAEGASCVPVPRAAPGQEIVLGGFGHHDLGGVAREGGTFGLGNEIVENLSGPNPGLIGDVLIGFVLRRNAHQCDALALAIIDVIE
jgi:hypothetical protein